MTNSEYALLRSVDPWFGGSSRDAHTDSDRGCVGLGCHDGDKLLPVGRHVEAKVAERKIPDAEQLLRLSKVRHAVGPRDWHRNNDRPALLEQAAARHDGVIQLTAIAT